MFLNSLNYFRAIAIILIVAGHSFHISNFKYEGLLGNTVYNLTVGGTAFFVFISGFLFHHIFYQRFKFRKFLKKKARYVLLPYLVMAFIPVSFLVLNEDLTRTDPGSFFAPAGTSWDAMYLVPFIKYYLSGFRIISYWYIPFIMIIFLMSPVFLRFLQLRFRVQLVITSLLLLLALFIHRPAYTHAWQVFHSVLYFTPVYLVGMLASQKKEELYKGLEGREMPLLVLGLLFAVGQVFTGQLGNSFKDPWLYAGIDLMLLQKLVLCFFLMIWLRRFENRSWPLMNTMANCSFGIFFIHGPVAGLLNRLKVAGIYTVEESSFLVYLLMGSALLLFSLLLTLLVQRLFPKHSRYLVGS